MTIVKDALQVSEIAFGYMGSKALFAALHIDLFTVLAKGPAPAAEVARGSGIPENRLMILMTALTSIGLLVKEGDRFGNSPGAEAFLVTGAKYDFGDYLRYQIDRQMFRFMANLENVIQGDVEAGAIDSYATWMADPDEARIYSEAQHSGSLGPGRSLAKQVDFKGVNHLLDVAGGTGAFAIELCQAWPQLNVTVIDFPNVVALGRAYVDRASLSARIKFVAGDALLCDWPDHQDAVLMSYLFSGVPGDQLPDLVEHAYRVLNAGGQYIVHDFMVDDDRQGPSLAALWQLQHMAFTPAARSVTPGWLIALLADSGFADMACRELIAGMTKVVMGRRPI